MGNIESFFKTPLAVEFCRRKKEGESILMKERFIYLNT
jgi:hypothetical protein